MFVSKVSRVGILRAYRNAIKPGVTAWVGTSYQFSSIVPFKLADIGEGIAEVELLKWFIKEGDKVKAFDRICEVQSDKATVEITSRYDGVVTKVHHSEGSIVKVGGVLVDIQTAADASVEINSKAAKPVNASKVVKSVSKENTPSAAGSIPFKLADIGEGIAEVELLKWFIKEGDKVKAFDRICEVQSDKATVEITSRYDGVVTKVHHSEGSIVKVGGTLIDIQTTAESSTHTEKPAAPTAKAAAVVAQPATTSAVPLGEKLRAQATPAVRKIAKEYNINLALVRPTGPKGRVTKEDVLLYIQNGNKTRNPVEMPPHSAIISQSAGQPVAAGPFRGDQVVPIRGVQRLMVKSMTAARQVQHLTLCEEVLFDKMKELRHELKSQFGKQGVKISYMPLLIKATSLALLDFPMLNASVNADVTEMTYHENHNIGVAMDTPKGLVVPVIKGVQNKSILEIARDLAELQEASQNNALTEAHLSGGTFSLSNIGSVGGTYAVPVVVVPQVAIGALGRLQVLPRYMKSGKPASLEAIEDGEAEVQPATIMNVSWSADHRVIDGATVAKFSNTWKKFVENPHLMLSQMR